MSRLPRPLATALQSILLVVGYWRRHGAGAAVRWLGGRLGSRLKGRVWVPLARLAGVVPPGVWVPAAVPRGMATDARYAAWQKDNGLTPAGAARLLAAVDMARRQGAEGQGGALPRFSVVMPVYNTPVALLDQAVASVVAQIYPDWELCIADDASTAPATLATLRRWAAVDPRIRIDFRVENGNISRATNAAAALAQGDFLAFLDHDDVLAPDALAEMALAVAADPDADFLYSDDDKIDMNGWRYAPQFKPGWSPVWLLSYMYIGHLKVVRRTLFTALGGFRTGFEGSQDYDFALRMAERARRVLHVPKVLYHWRAAPGSTATAGDAKPAAFEAGRRAVAEALARRGPPWPRPVEAIQPAWAMAGRLGVFSPVFPPVSASDGGVAVLPPDAGEDAVRMAGRDYLLFVSSGLQPVSSAGPAWETTGELDGVLAPMLGYLRMADVGAVGGRLLTPGGRIWEAGLSWGGGDTGRMWVGGRFAGALPADYGYLLRAATAGECAGVSFHCLLTPTRLYTGYLDHLRQAGQVPASDPITRGLDYGAWLAAGGRSCLYCPDAVLRWQSRCMPPRCMPPVLPAPSSARDRGGADPWGNPNLADDTPFPAIRPYRHPLGGDYAAPVRVACAAAGPPGERWPALLTSLAASGAVDPDIPWHTAEDGVWHFPTPDLAGAAASGPEVLCVVGHRAVAAVSAAARAGVPCLWLMDDGEGAPGPWRSWRHAFAFLPRGQRAAAHGAVAWPYRVIFGTVRAAQAWAPLVTRFNGAVLDARDPAGQLGAFIRQARDSRP